MQGQVSMGGVWSGRCTTGFGEWMRVALYHQSPPDTQNSPCCPPPAHLGHRWQRPHRNKEKLLLGTVHCHSPTSLSALTSV